MCALEQRLAFPPSPAVVGSRPLASESALIAARLAPRATAIFIRQTVYEHQVDDNDDIDLLAFGAVEELIVERAWPPALSGPSLDIIWLPAAWLDEPVRLARYGLITHRLLSSNLLWAADARVAALSSAVKALYAVPEHQQARLVGYLDMAGLTVREIGITWDFPPLALFWLHMAWVACLAAMLDGAGALCPNIYTRPLPYARQLEALGAEPQAAPLTQALRLADDVPRLVTLVRQAAATVQRQVNEPAWPEVIRPATRAEFRYWLDAAETEERIRTAHQMAAGGDIAGAVWYLRFCAYSLARLPLVQEHALEGTPTAFGRPARAMRLALERTCPEIVPLIGRILGGPLPLTSSDISDALAQLQRLRQQAATWLARFDFDLTACPPWQPYTRR